MLYPTQHVSIVTHYLYGAPAADLCPACMLFSSSPALPVLLNDAGHAPDSSHPEMVKGPPSSCLSNKVLFLPSQGLFTSSKQHTLSHSSSLLSLILDHMVI